MASNTESPSTVTTGPLSSSTCHVGDPGGLPSTTTPPHSPSHSNPLMPRPLCHLDYSPAAEHPVAEPSFFSPPCRLPPICVPFWSQGGLEVSVECKPKGGNQSSGNRDEDPQACAPAHASSLTIAAVGAGKAVYRIGSFRLQARVRWFHRLTLARPFACGLDGGYVIILYQPLRSAAFRTHSWIGCISPPLRSCQPEWPKSPSVIGRGPPAYECALVDSTEKVAQSGHVRGVPC